MDFQWHLPTEFHFPVVFSKGLSLVQWICTGHSYGFQWRFRMYAHFCEIWCVIFCPVSHDKVRDTHTRTGIVFIPCFSHWLCFRRRCPGCAGPVTSTVFVNLLFIVLCNCQICLYIIISIIMIITTISCIMIYWFVASGVDSLCKPFKAESVIDVKGHLLTYDLSRLSTRIPGSLSRKTALRQVIPLI